MTGLEADKPAAAAAAEEAIDQLLKLYQHARALLQMARANCKMLCNGTKTIFCANNAIFTLCQPHD